MNTNIESGSFKTKRRYKIYNADVLTNYELMLRIYLISKEQALPKQRLTYFAASKKAADAKADSSISNNISAVIYKANLLMNTFRRAKIALAFK